MHLFTEPTLQKIIMIKMKCSSMRRRYPSQPCERPPPGTVTLNNSVEYLRTQYLPSPHQEGGRDGKNQSTNWQANSKQLKQHFAKNCKQATAYISHEVPLLATSGHCRIESDKHLCPLTVCLLCTLCYLEYANNFSTNMELHMAQLRNCMQ